MKNKPYALLGVALFSLMATNAIAQPIRRPSCATWISERSQGGSRGLQVENWLDGYLSGLTVGSGTDFVTNTDPQSGYLQMDNYCRDHPLDNAADVGVFLINDALKKSTLTGTSTDESHQRCYFRVISKMN